MRRLTPPVPLFAVFLSILVHGAILVPAMGVFSDPRRDRIDQAEQGGIELLPVEVLGAEAADVERAADQPAPPTPETMVEANPSDPLPPDPDPAHAPDAVATAAVIPPPPLTPRAPAHPSLPLTLSLAGTDSASSAIAEGQALLPASPDNRSRNRPPVYPQEAVRRRLEGEVLLVIHVSSMGLAEGAEIVESSGHASLDRAAVDAVMTWRFRPAVRDGRPIGFDLPMRFGFTMR